MRFGLFYQQQMPKPWTEGTEVKSFNDHIEQAVLADELGFDSVWVTEHHFTEEYSHSSAPEIFLGAVAARTKRIHLGHGIRHMPPAINPPARVAEGIGTLDVISNGRVEFGIGEGATRLELGAYYITKNDKRAMCLEAGQQVANMMVMTPYPGFQGQYFKMECRNVVPKPVQKPHPPMWLACTNRDTILVAAQLGLGALCFSFVDPREAQAWTDAYYETIKSDQCVPLGHSVNARVAMVSPLSVGPDRAVAVRDGYHCYSFFKYALQSTIMNETKPGRTSLWEDYLRKENGDEGRDAAVREAVAAGDDYEGPSGTPADVAKRMRIFEEAGVDDMLFTVQGGYRPHEHICSTLTQFAADVMPQFRERGAIRRAERERELAPYIEAALARKEWPVAMPDEEIPTVAGVHKVSSTVTAL